MAESGIPSRDYLQVITVPGMSQEVYQWDARAGRLTAHFDAHLGPGDYWAAIETVSSSSANPCAILQYPAGDTTELTAARCAKAGPGLWTLTATDNADVDDTDVGFVRRVDGVTITLTGAGNDRAVLRRTILAAHPGNDAELWPRINGATARATFILL